MIHSPSNFTLPLPILPSPPSDLSNHTTHLLDTDASEGRILPQRSTGNRNRFRCHTQRLKEERYDRFKTFNG
jgi:hypothetical protein